MAKESEIYINDERIIDWVLWMSLSSYVFSKYVLVNLLPFG